MLNQNNNKKKKLNSKSLEMNQMFVKFNMNEYFLFLIVNYVINQT